MTKETFLTPRAVALNAAEIALKKLGLKLLTFDRNTGFIKASPTKDSRFAFYEVWVAVLPANHNKMTISIKCRGKLLGIPSVFRSFPEEQNEIMEAIKMQLKSPAI